MSASPTSNQARAVNFLQSGTGTIARTVQDKERDIVTHADFATDPEYEAEKALLTGERAHIAKLLDNADIPTARTTLGSTAVGDAVFIAASAAAARATLGSTATGDAVFIAASAAAARAVLELTAATQAAQEAATDIIAPVTPGRQHFHPSAAKGWVRFQGTSNVTIIGSYNVTSVTDNGTGDYTVNWETDFSTNNYATVATGSGLDLPSPTIEITSLTVGASRVITSGTNAGSYTARDSFIVCVVAFGDQ